MIEANDTLMSADDLAHHLDRGKPVTMLDVRWKLGGPPGIDEYNAGHIPGAVFTNLNTDLAAPAGGPHGRHPLPDAHTFGERMRALGVRQDAPVVVYDGGDSMAASRAWWLLRYFGHTDTKILDGGLNAWTGPVTTEVPDVTPGDFAAEPGGMPLLDAAAAAQLAHDGLLFDARAAERFRGEVEPIDPVAGHVPGAVSAPTTANTRPDGRFRTPDELRERFVKLGVTPDVAVGAYCGSGVTAAHELVALRLAGVEGALYADSWSGYITDSSRPVATGE